MIFIQQQLYTLDINGKLGTHWRKIWTSNQLNNIRVLSCSPLAGITINPTDAHVKLMKHECLQVSGQWAVTPENLKLLPANRLKDSRWLNQYTIDPLHTS